MKKNYLNESIFAIIAFVLMGFTFTTNAQVRYVDINPGIGTLNNAINGDTTDTGDRIDPENTVYRLKRVEDIYYITALIQNLEYPLTVVAEDGDGPRPYIALKTDENGSTPDYCFRPKGDLTLKNLHLTNEDDLDALSLRIIRLSAPGVKLTIDNCWLDKAGQAIIRLDDDECTINLTNSVFSNIGKPADPDNGRGIDDRGNSIDSILIENCTFYNITQRLIRDGGGHIKYAKINNNNFINVGHRGFGFGVIAGLDFTNNILHNVAYVPRDTSEIQAVFEIDSISQELIDLGFEQKINITNNSVYLDSTLFSKWLSDSTHVLFADETAQKFIDENTDAVWYMDEEIDFADIPEQGLAEQVDYQMDPNLDLSTSPFWINPEPANGVYHLDVPYDFSYTNSVAASGATDGGPIGDRNWLGELNSVYSQPLINSVRLYPNPASNFVNIEVEIENTNSDVDVKVFDVLGKVVTG